MKFYRIVYIFVFVFFTHSAAVSADDAQSFELMKEYVTALESGNDTTVNTAWSKIQADPSSQEYLKANYPNQYRSYKLWALKNRLEQLRGAESATSTPPVLGRATTAISRPNSQEPNQIKASEAKPSRASLNHRIESDSRSSVQSSNRFRQSNQDRLRSFR